MSLSVLWFSLIAVLWTGFLVLEGFDFGVGMLHRVVGRDAVGRQTVIDTIGPLWDANEVWLIVAGAAMFAAFPGWYATMFSGFYLALVVLLLALIVRGVSFEFRASVRHQRWMGTWDIALIVGSALTPLLVGVALADLVHGLPIVGDEFVGTFWDLLGPYALVGGLTVLLVCLLHGCTFLMLKTTGDLRTRAVSVARRLAPPTAVAVIVFMVWTFVIGRRNLLSSIFEVVAIVAVLGAAALVLAGRDGWAFTATAVTIGCSILSLFAALYPRVMVSTLGSANDLTIANTSSSSYSLTVMTIVAAAMLPIVLAYQAWTYYVFRRRVSHGD